MINNNFTKFNTSSEYNEFKASSAYTKPNVSWIVNENTIVSEPFIRIIEAGTIVYYDNSASTLKYCSPSDWNSGLGTAVAVAVVPNDHTPDGTVRCISVKSITSAGTQTTYDDNYDINPGAASAATGLTAFENVATWDNTIGGTVTYQSTGGNLSSNKSTYTGTTDVLDSNLKYNTTSTGQYIPNPYLPNGSPNPDYRNTVESTTGNCLSDFDGPGNTTYLVGLGASYVAANACRLYSTSGISAGQWYLPAIGEFCYILPRYNQIQTALSTVGGSSINMDSRYFTSTRYANNFWRWLDMMTGRVACGTPSMSALVCPFCALPASL